MKKIKGKNGHYSSLLLLTALLLFILSVHPVKADVTYTQVPVTYITGLDAYDEYTPAGMAFKDLTLGGISSTYKLVLDKASTIRININNYDYGTINTSNYAKTLQPMKFTIALDEKFINTIYTSPSINGSVYYGPLYMEAGTYYIKFEPATTTTGGTNASAYPSGHFNFGVLAERSNSTKTIVPSSFANPNLLTLNKEIHNFSTSIYPADWYKFTLTKDRLISTTFYRTSGSGKIDVSIYNSKRGLLKKMTIPDQASETEFSLYLEKGTYYLCLENEEVAATNTTTYTEGKGGNLNFTFKAAAANLTVSYSTKKKTNQNVTLTLNSNLSIDESVLISTKSVKSVTNSNKYSDSLWKKAKFTGGETISAAENGTYWLLAKDSDDRILVKKVSISNIDKKAPAKPTITSFKKGASSISGKAEKGSTVTITLSNNGRQQQYTTKANKKTGVWKVKTSKLTSGALLRVNATDTAGNDSETVTRNL